MEIITSISEIKPGDTSALHIHHGDEAFYVLEGGTIELPDGKQVPLATGVAAVNARDMVDTFTNKCCHFKAMLDAP